MPPRLLSWLTRLHGALVHSRRVEVLAERIAGWLPPQARVLDVGCGDGRLARALQRRRADLVIRGLDVLPRPDAQIETTPFDGRRIPFAEATWDVALLVDVLHHADEPATLLAEAARVARLGVVLKDHDRSGPGAAARLRFMDWVGNRGHGVPLPYAYLAAPQWAALFARLGLRVVALQCRLGLYGAPAAWLFEGRLHFLAYVVRRASAASAHGSPESPG